MNSRLQRQALSWVRSVHLGRRLLRRANPRIQAARAQRAAFYDQAWQDAARRLGAEIRPLEASTWEIQRGASRTRVHLNYTSLDDPVTLRVAGNKALVHRLLAEAGLPVPRHRSFALATLDEAKRFLSELAGPCVVKPCRGTGAGQGVTTGVRTPRQLLAAAATAASFQNDLLIEAMLPGANYRLLYLDGELLDVVRRDSPRLVGDGSATVATLVERMNRQRLHDGFAAAQTVLLPDLEMRHTLACQGLTMRSVPGAGRLVVLKSVVNDNQATDNHEARDEVCADIVMAGARAAAVLGIRLAGVDVISPDPRQALQSNGGAVLEVNTTPGFHMHYYRQGAPCAVAEVVLRRILETAPGVEPRPHRTIHPSAARHAPDTLDSRSA